MENPEGFFISDHLAHGPLSKLGWQVDDVPWTRPTVHWDDYQLVVIRSTWDYQQAPEDFLDLLERIDRSQARLENNLATVRWNINKTYLRDLQDRGVTIVPTRWLPGLDHRQVRELGHEFSSKQIVVKPIVGANADDTFRLSIGATPEETQAATERFGRREVMAQPFIDAIVTHGEYSLFYFSGVYSHAILKRPKAGDFRVQEEHGGIISSVTPEVDVLSTGQKAIDAIGSTLLYARVDLVHLADGQIALMELELIEPSLYFSNDAEAPGRFANAVEHLWDWTR